MHIGAFITSSTEHLFLDNKVVSIVSSLVVLCCMIRIAKIEEYLNKIDLNEYSIPRTITVKKKKKKKKKKLLLCHRKITIMQMPYG